MSFRKRREADARANAIIGALSELWPHTFVVYERRRKPLALGIHRALLVAVEPTIVAGTVTVKDIKRTLARCTRSNGYLRNMRTDAGRIDLAGRIVTTVTKDQAQHAKQILDQRRAERRAAKHRSRPRKKRPRVRPEPSTGSKHPLNAMGEARQATRAQARPRKSHVPNAIRAELIGSDTAGAAGIGVTAYTPVLELCRKLVAAGHDPATPLDAYRGGTLCLIVRSIGTAAALEINARGNGFRLRRAADAAPPIARKRPACVQGHGSPEIAP